MGLLTTALSSGDDTETTNSHPARRSYNAEPTAEYVERGDAALLLLRLQKTMMEGADREEHNNPDREQQRAAAAAQAAAE